jgi:hypothetical protein
MTKGLSKSRYTAFCQCPKNLWLKMYKPRLLVHGTRRTKASREALLRYCELDTWAMVKVWEKLKEVAE